jgi:hypothetical protein
MGSKKQKAWGWIQGKPVAIKPQNYGTDADQA